MHRDILQLIKQTREPDNIHHNQTTFDWCNTDTKELNIFYALSPPISNETVSDPVHADRGHQMDGQAGKGFSIGCSIVSIG